jgi:NADH:ubiquinone oxidoreductase subunit 6 (subunit J)
MNPTTETTQKSPIHALVDEVFGPVQAESGSARHRLLQVRSVLAYVGLVSTLVQIVVWLMVGVFTADLDGPWWLWTTVPAAAGVAFLTLADRWHGWFAGADTHTTHDNSPHNTAEVTR